MKENKSLNSYEELSRERKQLQKENKLQKAIATAGWQMLKASYLSDEERLNPRLRYETIAKTLASHIEGKLPYLDGVSSWETSFFNLLWESDVSPSSPMLTNTGNDRGLPVSCSGCYIEDSVDGFYTSLHENALLSKYGFGTSGYFGDVRPRGAIFGENGKATGSIPVFDTFVDMAKKISQGSQRRGAFAGYFDLMSPDFDELINYIRPDDDDKNIGFCVYKEDLEKWKNGDLEVNRRIAECEALANDIGKGYLFKSSLANELLPKYYKDAGLVSYASNLCVTGNQRVPSNKGLITAYELFELGTDLKLFDNEKVVKSSPMKLIEKNANVYKITLENGMTHNVTGYHKVKTNCGDKAITDLNIGDKVAIQTKKGIFGKTSMPKEAFLLGLYQGDGTQHKESIMIDLWENDFDLIDTVEEYVNYVCNKYKTQTREHSSRIYNSPKFGECKVSTGFVKKKRLVSRGLKKCLNFEKGYVPQWIWESNEKTQWSYIKGLFYADGTVNISKSKGLPLQLSLANIDKDFLLELQLILANLGMQTSIRLLRNEGLHLMPNGKGGESLYNSKKCYRLIIGNKNDALIFEKNTGFLSRKKISLEKRKYRDNSKKYYKVKSIKYIGKEDVYCVNVDSKEHHWVCNGIITHNCTEINLGINKDLIFTCVLLSINLANWDKIKGTNKIQIATIMLDCLASEFIKKAKEIKGLEKAVKFTEISRALGLGVCGFHSYLQKNMISFDSIDATYKNGEIFREIERETIIASEYMAKYLGECELTKGHGRRNASLRAIAPTKSTALIMGGVSEGINPFPQNMYTQKTSGGEVFRMNPELLSLMKRKKIDTDENFELIKLAGGSIQELPFFTEDEKRVFRTAFEIDQRVILRLAEQRQQYLDQLQSVNLFFAGTENEDYIHEIHQRFLMSDKLVSRYYVNGIREKGVHYQQDKQECIACQ